MDFITVRRKPVRYNDLYIRLIACVIGAHIFTVFGEPESTLEWLLKFDYYPAFLVSLLISFSVVSYLHWLSTRLDHSYDWYDHSLKRTLLQLLLGLGAPALFSFTSTFLYLKWRGVHILSTTYLSHDFHYLLLMLAIVNAYYIAYYFFQRWQAAEKAIKEVTLVQAGVKEGYYYVSQGSKNIPLSFDQIALFYREDDTNFLLTFDGERYYIPTALDDVVQVLDNRFFRLNRQVITHQNTIRSFKSIDNGKIDVELSPAPPEPAIVSQKRAKGFREWI